MRNRTHPSHTASVTASSPKGFRRGVGEAEAFIAAMRRQGMAPDEAAALVQVRLAHLDSVALGMVAAFVSALAESLNGGADD